VDSSQQDVETSQQLLAAHVDAHDTAIRADEDVEGNLCELRKIEQVAAAPLLIESRRVDRQLAAPLKRVPIEPEASRREVPTGDFRESIAVDRSGACRPAARTR
jgi:hypothetical protein